MNARGLIQLVVVAVLLASCSVSQPVAQRADDVYFMPSSAPATAQRPAERPQQQKAAPAPSDDYYDEGTSRDLGMSRGFYDMAYNDPYYYNYGRFGFGMGMMGWQSGWNGPGWGMGFGWGGVPWMSMGMGWGRPWGYSRPWGWNDPWAWNRPWGWNNPWNDPWGNGFGYGYGYGNYWGPMGPCLWYSPIGVSTNSVIGHRPSFGSAVTGSGSAVRQPRMDTRNPIGLQPAIVNHRASPSERQEPLQQQINRGGQAGGSTRPFSLQRDAGQRQDPRRAIERSPAQRGTIETRPSIGRGSDPSPSRSGGGGSAPVRRAR